MKMFRCFLLILCILFLSFFGSFAAQDTPIFAEKGVLDITEWDADTGRSIQLNGEWSFYWEKLLNYQELHYVKPDLYGNVPSSWDKYRIDGERLPSGGYATYKLHIKTALPEQTMLGLKIKSVSSAYKLYIDDKLIASTGTVGVDDASEVGVYETKAVTFVIPDEEFDLIIQVSNHQFDMGGLWYSISLGNAEAITYFNNLSTGLQFFIGGATSILVIFNLIIFMMNRELRYALYLAVFFVLLGFCSDIFGQLILAESFPVRADTIIFIWHTAMSWTIFTFMVFLNELYRSRFSNLALKGYLAVCIALQILYTFTDSMLYTKAIYVSVLIWFAGAVLTLIITAVGVRNGRKDGWLHIVGIFILVFAYFHDLLYWGQVLHSGFAELGFAGMMIFLVIQINVEAKRIRQYMEEKRAAELILLQAQIKPHFLYNALNTIVSVSRYDTDSAREILLNLSSYLRRSFDFRELSQTVPLRHEVELAQAYINIEKARFQERLEVDFDVCDVWSAKVPILVLQPIIENAVNHGVLPREKGGRVAITIRQDGSSLAFSVKDDGFGIEKPDHLLFEEPKYKYGSGVGLANVNKRLIRLYGKGLTVRSKPGLGTEVTWEIPIDKKEISDEKSSDNR